MEILLVLYIKKCTAVSFGHVDPLSMFVGQCLDQLKTNLNRRLVSLVGKVPVYRAETRVRFPAGPTLGVLK